MAQDETSRVGVIANEELTSELRQGRLVINFDLRRIQPCSYDMRVGTVFRDGQAITDAHPKGNEQLIIRPGEVISMFTLEEVSLPSDVIATAFPMNSLSSQGLLVLNPGHVDPGFKGPLTVRALNMRKVPLAISRGEPILTLIFERIPKAANPPYLRIKPRDEREREFNKMDVETSMRSLSELVALDSPFPTHKEVREIVRAHWLSWITLAIAVIGALAAVVAAVASIVAVVQNFQLSQRQTSEVFAERDAKKTEQSSTKSKQTDKKAEQATKKVEHVDSKADQGVSHTTKKP